MTIFERFPKTTLLAILLLLGAFALYSLEWGAKTFFGLGKVVLYDTHPLYGYRPHPHQTVARHPDVTIQINNLGLRAEKDWDPIQTDHKILFLGDSVTYGGSYIANHQLFSTLVGHAFPGWEAGNAGVNGWGISNVAAFIMKTAFLPADVYVSVFPEGDFYRGVNRIGGQPFWTVPPRFALEELLHYGIYTIHLKKTPQLVPYDPHDKMIIAQSAVQDLKALDDFLAAHHKNHFIYITPSREQIINHAPIDQTVFSLLKKYHLNVTYIADYLAQEPVQEKQQWYHDAIHLSARGHQIWAHVIATDLSKRLFHESSKTFA